MFNDLHPPTFKVEGASRHKDEYCVCLAACKHTDSHKSLDLRLHLSVCGAMAGEKSTFPAGRVRAGTAGTRVWRVAVPWRPEATGSGGKHGPREGDTTCLLHLFLWY